MKSLLKSRQPKIGQPAGSSIYIGKQRKFPAKVTLIDYDQSNFEYTTLKKMEEYKDYADKKTVTWIDVDGAHDVEIVKNICDSFGLHPLVQEDILNTDQRPKIEYYDKYIYLVLKMLSFDKKQVEVNAEQVSLVLGENFVLSFQEKSGGDVFQPIRERLKISSNRIRKSGPDYLVYSLFDIIIDNYFLILEGLGEKVESLEEELVINPSPKTLQVIHSLKQEMIYLRRSVWPLREVINSLEREETKLVRLDTKVYLRDIYDHTIQIIDVIETFRDVVSGMIDVYLSSINNKLNEVVKILTIITTIFMPLTFVAGVYGMNFKFMPELTWRLGYLWALFLMFLVAFVMIMFFRKKKWL